MLMIRASWIIGISTFEQKSVQGPLAAQTETRSGLPIRRSELRLPDALLLKTNYALLRTCTRILNHVQAKKAKSWWILDCRSSESCPNYQPFSSILSDSETRYLLVHPKKGKKDKIIDTHTARIRGLWGGLDMTSYNPEAR